MNDAVLELDARRIKLPVRFRSLSLPFVIQLGQEIYAQHPRLQHTDPDRAKRLAMLLATREAGLNAALFVAPAEGCPPADVAVRFCNLSIDVMAGLYARQNEGALTAVACDRQVWRRLAA